MVYHLKLQRKLSTNLKTYFMTFVKLNNKQSTPSFNNLIDDFFTGMPSILRNEIISPELKQAVPVNIREKEKEYILEVFAPGFDKEDFQVNLDKNILTVSSEKKNETDNKDEKEILREYKYKSFKRSFTIDEKID